MTDADIIKALECCTKGNASDVCSDCSLKTTDICTDVENGLMKLALDLIKRKDAEIYELSEKLNATIAGQETLQEYIAQRSPLGMAGDTE